MGYAINDFNIPKLDNDRVLAMIQRQTLFFC